MNTSRPTLVWLLLSISMTVTSLSAHAVQYYIEAEDCEGLPYYPFDNEVFDGWYAREANVRHVCSGHGIYAVINESTSPDRRVMTRVLPVPVKPGTYKVFLRTYGPAKTYGPVQIDVDFGTQTQANFKWEATPKNRAMCQPRWRPSTAKTVTFEKPVTRISFIARPFKALGASRLYEQIGHRLCVDTLYLTSDLDECHPPAEAHEFELRAGYTNLSEEKRPSYACDELGPSNYQTPSPVENVKAATIPFKAFDDGKNMWPNSSFELGMNDGWSAKNTERGCYHVFTDADLDTRTPFDGKYSLRVPGKIDGYPVDPFSRMYELKAAGVYTLSLYLRGHGGQVKAFLKKINRTGDYFKQIKTEPVITLSCKVEQDWRRFSATTKLEPGEYALYLESDDEFWLDGVQLERGSEATKYQPRAMLEGGVRTGCLANIIYKGERKDLTGWFYNSGKKKTSARLDYEIRNVRDQVVGRGTTDAVEIPPGETFTVKLPILPDEYGVYSVQYAVHGRNMPEGETVFLIMPRPSDTLGRHLLGANTPPCPGNLAVNQRIGMKWLLTIKSLMFGAARKMPIPGNPNGAHPAPGVWNWEDEKADLILKHKMVINPGLWPEFIPLFMQKQVEREMPSIFGVRKHVPDAELWKEHVEKVVDHYKGKINWWCIDDEVECNWHLAQLIPMVKETVKSAKKANLNTKIGISGRPEVHEELIENLGEIFDFFGGSTFDLQYWEGRYWRYLKDKYHKPLICYGVGARYPQRSMYHTFPDYKPVYWKAATMARRLVHEFLNQDIDVLGPYTAAIKNNGLHVPIDKQLFDYDATPLPWGAPFAILGNVLANAIPLGEVAMDKTDRFAYLFKLDGKLATVTWATLTRDFDHHFRPWPREYKNCVFKCPENSIELKDMFWNPKSGSRWKNGELHLDINEEPVFFVNKNLSAEQFKKIFETVEIPKAPLIVKLSLSKGKDGTLDLNGFVKNDTGKVLENLSVDFRLTSQQPFLSSSPWLLRKTVWRTEKLSPGESKKFVLPTCAQVDRPLPGIGVRAFIRADNLKDWAFDDYVWYAPARKRTTPITFDGKFDDWRNRWSNWICYDWGWSVFSRHIIQLYENGQYFGYPPYRIDVRTSFQCDWDERNLYLAIRVEDDDLILNRKNGEAFRIIIDNNGKRAEIIAIPLPDHRVSVEIVRNGKTEILDDCGENKISKESLPNGALAKKEDVNVLSMELRIPWRKLGVVPEHNMNLGFDIFQTDADHEKNKIVRGSMRWAGRANKHGNMILTNK